MNTKTFDRLSFLSLFAVIVLLPLFCLPFTSIPVETSKGLLLVAGLALSIIFWAIARFTDGEVIMPKSWLLVSGGAICLVFLISALISSSSQVSLFGVMFDVGSFWFIFTAFILMLMSSVVFRTPKQAKIVLLGMILSSGFVLIFQSLHLFFPTLLSLGVLGGKTGNILGSWNALGLFAGFAGLMFLLVVEFFPISKIEQIILQIFILLSILLVAAINYPLVWILLGISSLIIFVYKVSITSRSGEETEKKKFPILSFIIVMLSLLFFMSGNFIGGFIPNHLGLTNTEISPSFSATMSITKGVLKSHPVLGIGPNKFNQAWAMYKPLAINATQFWDVGFSSGSGLLPTLTATTGGLGILAWLVFLVLFLVSGAKSVFSSIRNKANWEMMAFFLLSLYLFISSFFYATGAVMFLLSLAFTGVFIGLSTRNNEGQEISVSFLNDHRKSFFSFLVLIVLIIASAAGAFKYIERLASVSYYSKALSAQTVPVAEDSINKALTLYTNDLYLRTYSQIYLVDLNSIASKSSTPTDADKTALQNTLNQVISGANAAVAYDKMNYLNYQLIGSIYRAVGTLGVKDAYSQSVTAFKSASALNPQNPGLILSMATSAFADGKVQDAKDYANQALALKPDYVDALVTLSQIAKSEGNSAQALSYAQKALAITPTDQNLIQYVNTLNGTAPAPTTPSKTSTTPPTKQ